MSLLLIKNGVTPLLLLAEIRTFTTVAPFLTGHFNLLFFYLLLNQSLPSSTFKLNEVVSPAWKINVKPLHLHLIAVSFVHIT